MESESDPAGTAAELLAAHRRVSERARVVPREYVLMLIWSALFVAAFIAAHLLTASTEEPTSPMTLLLPIVAFGSLIQGTNERFGVRPRLPRAAVIISVVLLVSFFVLLALAIFGPGYPWWVGLALPIVCLAGFVPSGRRLLMRSRRDEHSTWSTGPLSMPVRASTCFVGSAMGVLIATQSFSLAAAIAAVVTMVTLAALIFAWTTPFGLNRVGFEWGRIHWIAFGFATALSLATSVLGASTTILRTPMTLILGVLAAAPMIATAFVATRER
ncbi:hypothetical protein [Microbacterium suaedae]|uniref:hypothetical protein n=1 Tax=Microbacterium suaedae TaxID=2067813 RepID=UPI000DA148B3|nr:hypothetical protein [Microbacterium suaedae]